MSIQQRIASDVYRMAEKAVTPEQIKSIQAHLVKSVQTGAVPSYVGVPLLSDLNQRMARIQTAPAQAQAMVQQPPIAQQVMGQAGQGVEALPSGLPVEGMAGGGIVAFAGGGMSDYEMASQLLSDEDDEDEDYVKAILGDIYNRESSAGEEEAANPSQFMATQMREAMSMKEGNEPPRGVTRERTSVTAPAGVEALLKMIEQKESGGRDYDKYGKLLTSPAGAQGRMQVMPATSRDPGFNIRPAKEGDVEDLARVGREYYVKMLDRYQDPKIAAIAYNWGPGNTDKWLSSGADMSRLPAETRNYVANMREGGIASVKRFQYGGISATSPFDVGSLGLDDLKRMASMGERSAIEELAKRQSSMGISSIRAASPSVAEMNLSNPRVVGGATQAAQAVQAAQPSFLESAKNALSRLRPGVGGLGVGLPALFHSGDLNANEEEELARRRQMPMTIGVPSKVSQQTAPRMPVTSSNTAGQSYKRTQGPTKEGMEEAELLSGVDLGFDPKQFSPQPEETQEKSGAAKEEGGIRELLNKYREDLREQRETDKYLSLLSAGLGMMGGTSPFASANIGQGALQGVKTYQQAAQLRGADDRALLSGEVALKKYQDLADIRRAQIEGQKGTAQAKALAGLETKAAEAMRRYEMQAENDSRMIAEARIKAASKDLINPMSDEQRSAIYADERAKALSKLRMNPVYRKHMGVVVPGYEFDDNSAATQSVLNYDPKTKSLR